MAARPTSLVDGPSFSVSGPRIEKEVTKGAIGEGRAHAMSDDVFYGSPAVSHSGLPKTSIEIRGKRIDKTQNDTLYE